MLRRVGACASLHQNCRSYSQKALLNEAKLMEFMEEKIASLGTSACPPYHLCIVVGGLSAEQVCGRHARACTPCACIRVCLR